MCGISGFIDFQKKSTKNDIIEMIQSLHHRGPDNSNFYFNDTFSNYNIAFGHNRLSIIDTSVDGNQPFYYKNLVLVYNGEIYNFEEIKKELANKGHTFLGKSDTEVLIHAFEEWGVSCIEKLFGMFSIAIYDAELNKAFFIRDRVGVKPFYYYLNESNFVFCSELKALHTYSLFEKEIDINSLALFFQYGYVPTPYSIFKDVYKLEPGHFIELDLPSKKVSKNTYWNVNDYYAKSQLQISYEEAKSEIKELLISAFNYRMISDVPVGVFLSGGYDSTCVTALLSKTRSEKIKTFTIGFNADKLNEAPFAKMIANHLNTDHYEFYCTEEDALKIVEYLPDIYDEPFGDSSAIPTILISQKASEHVKVVLSADGGDEVFAGYNRYTDYLKMVRLTKITPKIVKKSVIKLVEKEYLQRVKFIKSRYNIENRLEKLKDIFGDKSDANLIYSLYQQYTNSQVRKLFKQNICLNSIFYNERYRFSSPLKHILALDYQLYLNDDILQKVDRATMSTSIEGREPFLDHRIIEYVARLPLEFKINKNQKKIILKDIVHDIVPKELMDRPKMGFAVPVNDWLSGVLRSLVEKFLNEEFIQQQNIFNWNQVSKLKSEYYSGKKEHSFKIWYFLMFQMWYEKWM